MSRQVPELMPEPLPAGFGQVPDVMDPTPGIDDIINPGTIGGAVVRIIANPTPLNEGEEVPDYYEYPTGRTAVWECGGRLYAL